MTYSRKIIFFLLVLLPVNQIVKASDSTGYKLGKGYHISHWGPEKDPDIYEIRLFRSINSSRSTFKDDLLPTVNSTFMPVIVSMPISMIVYGASSRNTYDENTGFLLTAAEITNFGVTFMMKSFSSRLRPYLSLRNVYYRLIRAESLYSFPSGHASHSFCMSTMFALRYPTKPYIYLPMFLWSTVICYGRSYLGLHYPVDILGGISIGTISSIIIYSLRTDIIKILKGKDAGDANSDFSTSGKYAAGSFFLSAAANTLVTAFLKNFPQKNVTFSFSPVMNKRGPGVGIDMRW